MNFSLCESVHATGSSPWHIRANSGPLKLGGGIDTPSLCMLVQAGWDLAAPVADFVDKDFMCKSCVAEYRARLYGTRLSPVPRAEGKDFHQTHLPGSEALTLCGAVMAATSSRVSEVLAEVTCEACQTLAANLSVILTRARRNGSGNGAIAKTGVGGRSVLEELQVDGSWRLFDLKRWLREVREGQYDVTLRVRPSRPAGEGGKL